MIRAILTDVEGTTTPIAFVTQVLFPHARAALPGFLAARRDDPEVSAQLDAARREAGDPALSFEQTVARLLTWIDEDRKIGPLKTLQGLVWREGYADGTLRGQVYPDVPEALRRWRDAGLAIHVYSSGSVEAQRLLFRHSELGDLTGLFDGHFDTSAGPKLEARSYTEVARRIGMSAAAILFLSDNPAELRAAREAGLAVIQLDRAAKGPSRAAEDWAVENSFAGIDPAHPDHLSRGAFAGTSSADSP